MYDNWQVYKPLDYFDFPKSRGPIVDIRYIGSSRTLFRLEQSLYVTQLATLQTSAGQVTLGSGRLFNSEPEEVVFTKLGYSGTQSQWAFDVCEFGAFFVNANRGKVFNLAGGIKDITEGEYKAANWFAEHLPFKLSKQILGVPEDNPYNPNGIGIHSVYDPKHKIWLLTKKDYELADPKIASQYTYADGKILFNGGAVQLKDGDHFANRSFTIAFSPLEKGWVSFQSFIPDSYLAGEDTFSSVQHNLGVSSVFKHGRKDFFATFFGKRCPFIIEYTTKIDGVTTGVHAHSTFMTTAYRLVGNEYEDIQDATFNKAIVFNNKESTGLLNLVIQDENDLSTLYTQLKTYASSKDIALRRRDNQWNFSDYFNIHKGKGFIFTSDWKNVDFRKQYFIDKVLVTANHDYSQWETVGNALRGQFTKTRLILDNDNSLKLLFQVGIEATRASYT